LKGLKIIHPCVFCEKALLRAFKDYCKSFKPVKSFVTFVYPRGVTSRDLI